MEVLANAMHPLLHQNSPGPSGEHFPYSDATQFPHIDEAGTCWIPKEYAPSDDTDKWLDYEDSTSEIMRAECEL